MKNTILKKTMFALGASVAIASMPMAADMPKYPVLDYVPADTVLFSASLEPFPIKMYYDLNAEIMGATVMPEKVDEMLEGELPSEKFFASLVSDYYANIGDSGKLLANYGFGDETRALIYAVDFTPVIKYEAANPEALWAVFDKAAADAGITSTTEEMGSVKYKTYSVDNEAKTPLDFVVGVNGNWVTITLAYPNGNNDHLAVALGSEMPQKSLNGTNILNDIMNKYNFDAEQIGYIDHRLIIDRLTSDKPIGFVGADDWEDIAEMRTPACKAEFAALAVSWPRTVLGNHTITLTPTEYSADSRIIIESTNTETNAALMELRGYIPAHVRVLSDKVFSMAFGINANNMTGTLTKLWSSVTQATYECPALIEMQESITEANPAAIGMFTGMAQGIMGISATVYEADIDFSGVQPEVRKLDALVSLASENPASQMATAAMMLPPLAAVKLPADGTAIELNGLIPPVNMIGGTTLAAAVGKHLNVYQGAKAAEVSAGMSDEGIEPNGFFSLYMHYGKYFSLLGQIMDSTGEDVPPEFAALENSNIQIGMDLDFTDNGIEFGALMELKK